MRKEMEKYKVNKSNVLMQSKIGLKLNEQKLLCIFTSLIQPEDTEFNEITLSVKQLGEILDIEEHNLYTEIPKITKNLLSKVIEFKKPLPKGKPDKIQMTLLTKATYSSNKGTLTLEYHEDMKPHLLQLKKYFSSYELKNILSLKSKYSMPIYEMCKSKRVNSETQNYSFIWSVEDIRYILELNTKAYDLFGKIKEKALEPAFTEINNNTDLKTSFELIKEGRRVIAIKVDVTIKKIKSSANKKLIDSEQFHINDVTKRNELVEQYSEVLVNQCEEYVDKKLSKGEKVSDRYKYIDGMLKMKSNNIQPKSKKPKADSFNNFDQREYDFKELERQFLPNLYD